MDRACVGFEIEDLKTAWNHMQFEILEDYGDYAYGHFLHTWDAGKRMLAKCKNCGGYILIQKSEFHSFSDDDSYYTDYFPVSGSLAAAELNRKHDGFQIEREFPLRFIRMSNLRLSWSSQQKGRK
ncbi:MAG: hypothetical protein IJ769_10830 [Clostridia bacterium]|nr:hypothetical protein [Clostridia bacterium]